MTYSKSIAFRQPQLKNNAPATIEHIIGLISRARDRGKVLGAILPCALAIAQAQVGALLVIDDNKKNMVVVARQDMPDEVIEQLTTGALGHLLLVGQWVQVEPKSVQSNPKQALLGRHNLKCLLGIPFQFDKQVLGAIVVGTRVTSENLLRDNQQQQKLATLARLVALFLDNVRLRTGSQPKLQETTSSQDAVDPPDNGEAVDDLEDLLEAVMSAEEEVAHQNSDLGLLNALSHEMGQSLQLNMVLETALKQTRQALKVEAVWCYLLQNDTLTLCQYQGVSEKYAAGMRYLAPHEGVEGMAFSRNERIVRDGVLFHSGKARSLVQDEGLGTIAAVPLTVGEKPVGVLAVANHHERAWSTRDKWMLTSIGGQVAQAISNAQTFTEATEKAQDWEAKYSQLEQTNSQLARQAMALEQQVQELQQAKQHIWAILAASSQARHRGVGQNSNLEADENLEADLRKVLDKLNKDESQPSPELRNGVVSAV